MQELTNVVTVNLAYELTLRGLIPQLATTVRSRPPLRSRTHLQCCWVTVVGATPRSRPRPYLGSLRLPLAQPGPILSLSCRRTCMMRDASVDTRDV